MRIITSLPATKAAISALPLMPPCCCATAREGGNTVAPGCAPAPGRVRLSSSKACASAPLASAAAGARTALPRPRSPLLAAGACALDIVDDDAAPRQRGAADAGGDRVDDRLLGRRHHRARQILEPQP